MESRCGQWSGDQGAARNLHKVGCLGRITQFSETDDGRYLITLTGICRYEYERELPCVTAYRQAQVTYDRFAADIETDPPEPKINREKLLSQVKLFLTQNNLEANWGAIEKAGTEALVNSLCMLLPFGISEKQALLEAQTVADRAEILTTLFQMAVASSDNDSEPTMN